MSDDVTTGKRGIELLGDAIEADGRDSVNPRLYGNIHNLGHVFIAFVHDYNNAHKVNRFLYVAVSNINEKGSTGLKLRQTKEIDYVSQMVKSGEWCI